MPNEPVKKYNFINYCQSKINPLRHSLIKCWQVHILSHIPPGNGDCWTIFSREFSKIINRFESTVAAQFYGHTHKDEFKIFYDLVDRNRPTNVAFIGPSLTPFTELNPGYRVYTIDGSRPGSTWVRFWLLFAKIIIPYFNIIVHRRDIGCAGLCHLGYELDCSQSSRSKCWSCLVRTLPNETRIPARWLESKWNECFLPADVGRRCPLSAIFPVCTSYSIRFYPVAQWVNIEKNLNDCNTSGTIIGIRTGECRKVAMMIAGWGCFASPSQRISPTKVAVRKLRSKY